MPKAIEEMVGTYVRFNNRRALDDLMAHREKMAIDLKGRSGFDFSLPIGQIEEEIAAIAVGIEKLSRPETQS